MRICLDARMLKEGVVTGLGRYAEGLVRGLAALDVDAEFTVLLNRTYRKTLVNHASFREIRTPSQPERPLNLLLGAHWIGRSKPDIYHALFHFLPLGISGKAVLTLHDLIWLEHADLSYPRRVTGRIVHAYASLAMGYSIRRADHIIAISRHVAERAQSVMGVAPSRLSVVYHGLDSRILSAADSPLPPCTGPPYFLVVGHSKPYKNVPHVLRAFAAVAEQMPQARLRLVGRGEGYVQLRRLAEQLGLVSRVDFVRQVPDEQLFGLMRRCVALVFPSLVEGFGMPIIEAQALGCPVITSNRGAPAEIAGGAALLVDPLDVGDIGRAMVRLFGDEQLRRALAESGREHAQKFTWRRAALETFRAYQRAMAA